MVATPAQKQHFFYEVQSSVAAAQVALFEHVQKYHLPCSNTFFYEVPSSTVNIVQLSRLEPVQRLYLPSSNKLIVSAGVLLLHKFYSEKLREKSIQKAITASEIYFDSKVRLS